MEKQVLMDMELIGVDGYCHSHSGTKYFHVCVLTLTTLCDLRQSTLDGE